MLTLLNEQLIMSHSFHLRAVVAIEVYLSKNCSNRITSSTLINCNTKLFILDKHSLLLTVVFYVDDYDNNDDDDDNDYDDKDNDDDDDDDDDDEDDDNDEDKKDLLTHDKNSKLPRNVFLLM